MGAKHQLDGAFYLDASGVLCHSCKRHEQQQCVASPSFVTLGDVSAGINTEVDITITNTTSQDILLTDVHFTVVNAQGLAQTNITVPANGTAQAQVFMGPVSTGPAVMRVRWRGGSESTNWVTITASGI